MATIQKIKNKNSFSYKVLIRNRGLRTIIKTFPKRHQAVSFINDIENNPEVRKGLSSREVLIQDVIAKYLANGYKGKRLEEQISKLDYWSKYLSDSPINSLSSSQIIDGLSNLPKHLSNATKNRYKAAISVVFTYAQRHFNLVNNPVKNIPSYKENNARTRYLSNEEKTSLLEACRNSHWNKLYLIVLMAITTGARKGELERLKWSDIDFDRGLAYVHQTKNGEPRVLPLTQQVLTEMVRVDRDAELIFNSSIKPTKAYEFRKEWIKALKRADIKDFRFHDLRHTCASYLAQNGASLLEIADVLGHKQIQMTKRYAHLCVSHKQKLIEKYFGEI